MGEIAEDMIDGSCCQLCGCYFRHPSGKGIYVHDHPAVCNSCWNELTKKEKKFHVKCDKGIKTF
jgi:hypothetical protein